MGREATPQEDWALLRFMSCYEPVVVAEVIRIPCCPHCGHTLEEA